MEDMRDAQSRALQAALLDQEAAGIDVFNGRELVGDVARHSPCLTYGVGQ